MAGPRTPSAKPCEAVGIGEGRDRAERVVAAEDEAVARLAEVDAARRRGS